MFLRELSLSAFRPFDSVSIKLSPRVNIFFGRNGKGKTSILEAINLLSTGKSFRTSDSKKLIKHTRELLTVSGVVAPQGEAGTRSYRAGVEISLASSKARSRVDGENVGREFLAKSVATQLLDSDSLAVISGGPEGRRKFLDWLLFHVEQDFLPEWRRYTGALKQRNAMLKSGALKMHGSACGGDVWLKILQEAGDIVTKQRKDALRCVQEEMVRSDECQELLGFFSEPVSLSLLPGWDDGEHSLERALMSSLERDSFRGYTSVGPHRADIQVRIGGYLASDVCSRGQLKRLMAAMYLARNRVFTGSSGKKGAFLIDDIMSELDESSFLVLLQGVLSSHSQVFITCLNEKDFRKAWNVLFTNGLIEKELRDLSRWFHVEHGIVEQSCIQASSTEEILLSPSVAE